MASSGMFHFRVAHGLLNDLNVVWACSMVCSCQASPNSTSGMLRCRHGYFASQDACATNVIVQKMGKKLGSQSETSWWDGSEWIADFGLTRMWLWNKPNHGKENRKQRSFQWRTLAVNHQQISNSNQIATMKTIGRRATRTVVDNGWSNLMLR